MFCQNCGAEINDHAVVCVKCGVSVVPTTASVQASQSDEWMVAFVLCLLLGGLGIHRFYTKNTGTAVLQLVLGLVSCFIISGIWALVDLILLLTGNFKTGDGRRLTHN